MAVTVELVAGKKADQRSFESAYSKVTDHLFFQCLDDEGSPQGISFVEEPVHTAPKARHDRHGRGDHKRREVSPGDGQGGRRREDEARSDSRGD